MKDSIAFLAFLRGLLPDSNTTLHLGDNGLTVTVCEKHTGRWYGYVLDADDLEKQIIDLAGELARMHEGRVKAEGPGAPPCNTRPSREIEIEQLRAIAAEGWEKVRGLIVNNGPTAQRANRALLTIANLARSLEQADAETTARYAALVSALPRCDGGLDDALPTCRWDAPRQLATFHTNELNYCDAHHAAGWGEEPLPYADALRAVLGMPRAPTPYGTPHDLVPGLEQANTEAHRAIAKLKAKLDRVTAHRDALSKPGHTPRGSLSAADQAAVNLASTIEDLLETGPCSLDELNARYPDSPRSMFAADVSLLLSAGMAVENEDDPDGETTWNLTDDAMTSARWEGCLPLARRLLAEKAVA